MVITSVPWFHDGSKDTVTACKVRVFHAAFERARRSRRLPEPNNEWERSNPCFCRFLVMQ
jgi:hypothetical protein